MRLYPLQTTGHLNEVWRWKLEDISTAKSPPRNADFIICLEFMQKFESEISTMHPSIISTLGSRP